MPSETPDITHVAVQVVELVHEPIAAHQRLIDAQAATTGYVELGTLGDCSIGLWEMSAGTMTDIEDDEYFVVLAGQGTVQVLEANGFAAQTQQLAAGSLVHLHTGMQTVWHVEQPLRKMYVTPTTS